MAARAATAAVVGGVSAELGGGKFINGAVTGAFSRLYNDEMHPRQKRAHKLAERARNRLLAGAQDGHITWEEATAWWRHGNGAALSADLSKIDLSGINVSDFPGGIGSSKAFNLLDPNFTGSLGDALVYGNITLTLRRNAEVVATYAFDTYDFDMKPGISFRNVMTLGGSVAAGSGTPFTIMLYGRGSITP